MHNAKAVSRKYSKSGTEKLRLKCRSRNFLLESLRNVRLAHSCSEP
jgi:hypothetical protein